METYTELKTRQGVEFGEFPICFAFSEKQLQEALHKLGAKLADVCTVGEGSVIKKADIAGFRGLTKRHKQELQDAFNDDDFMIEAIDYELGNHEYGYTLDPSDTIRDLGLNLGKERDLRCFNIAKEQYLNANKDN